MVGRVDIKGPDNLIPSPQLALPQDLQVDQILDVGDSLFAQVQSDFDTLFRAWDRIQGAA